MIQSYIPKDKDFLAIFIELRAAYDLWFKEEKCQKYASVSKKDTLAGTLDEVNNEVYTSHIYVYYVHAYKVYRTFSKNVEGCRDGRAKKYRN